MAKRQGVARIIAHEGCPECGDRFCDGNPPHDGLNAGPSNSILPEHHSRPHPEAVRLVAVLIRIKRLAGGFNQQSLTDACLRMNRIEEIAHKAIQEWETRSHE